MGKALEFALATLMICAIHISFTFWTATIVGNQITELFNQLIEAFPC